MSSKVNQFSEQNLYIGIDGGGSKCKAKLVSADGSVQSTGIAGRANPVHGYEVTIDSIVKASEQALINAGLSIELLGQVTAGIGLAGVNLKSPFMRMNSWEHPFKSMFLTTDLHIACLGAHDFRDGAVIICGTGSCGIAIRDNQTHIYGAHGLPLGDQGSGAWIGAQALSAILLEHDGLGHKTNLSAAICNTLGASPSDLTDLMLGQPSKEYAKLAPIVFEQAENGDGVAKDIIQRGADYLQALANKILAEHQDIQLSMIGGLTEKIVPWMDSNLQQHILKPIRPPEDGAIYYAWSKTNAELACILQRNVC